MMLLWITLCISLVSLLASITLILKYKRLAHKYYLLNESQIAIIHLIANFESKYDKK